MDLAIAQRLTCPRPHATTTLVARVDELVGGRLFRGLLGCPECNGEWDVAGGVARFGPCATHAAVDGPDAAAVGAFLGLTEPEGIVVVDGLDSQVADALSRDFGAVVVALDPVQAGSGSNVIVGAERVPLATASARGVVLLRAGRDAPFAASAVAALVPAGRMLATASLPVPPGVRELARDAHLWVAERERLGVPVSIRRRGG